jgi:hypothetical protein
MSINRYDTEFSIRYAVRLHERAKTFWNTVGSLFRLAKIISGSVAVMFAIEQNAAYTIGMCGLFALFQALDITVNPSARKFEALEQRKIFAKLFAKSLTLSNEDLYKNYMELVADDETEPLQILRELAYNDVTKEQGLDSTYLYVDNTPCRALFKALS